MSHRRVLPRLFVPSLNQVVYHGSYLKLNGVTMSEVYQSTLRISFDVRGGLLIRQIHHWAADLFMAAMSAHLLRHSSCSAAPPPCSVMDGSVALLG